MTFYEKYTFSIETALEIVSLAKFISFLDCNILYSTTIAVKITSVLLKPVIYKRIYKHCIMFNLEVIMKRFINIRFNVSILQQF